MARWFKWFSITVMYNSFSVLEPTISKQGAFCLILSKEKDSTTYMTIMKKAAAKLKENDRLVSLPSNCDILTRGKVKRIFI